MKFNRQTATLFSVAGLTLTLLGIVAVVLFFNTTRSKPEEITEIPITKTIIATNSTGGKKNRVQQKVVDTLKLMVKDLPTLLPVDYPPGSVGETCGVNGFPNQEQERALSQWYEYRNDLATLSNQSETMRNFLRYTEKLPSQRFNPNDRYTPQRWNPLEQEIVQTALDNEQCHTALAQHVKQINPYLWGRKIGESFYDRAISFVLTDNSMTFERVFKKTSDDFARVKEALTRPECQLGEGESNWNLNTTCHADAFHNTALVMWFCYNEGGEGNGSPSDAGRLVPQSTPSSGSAEQTHEKHTMWHHALEHRWVKEKCKSLDLNTDPQSPVYAELRKLIAPLVNANERERFAANEALIKLAARLGDDAAGLTRLGSSAGRFAGWFKPTWNDPANLFTKHPPSGERLSQFISLFAEKTTKEGKPFLVNHEALVQHLCTPPYHTNTPDYDLVTEPPSCRDIVAELRQELHDNQTFLRYIDTFEDVAIRLDVYE
ncbi:MAG: hypothetical protein OXG88_09630 [Gammaproteobacteria bacterium]|nr:hypothetical protein [Gammaproteobacteria bacterium]